MEGLAYHSILRGQWSRPAQRKFFRMRHHSPIEISPMPEAEQFAAQYGIWPNYNIVSTRGLRIRAVKSNFAFDAFRQAALPATQHVLQAHSAP